MKKSIFFLLLFALQVNFAFSTVYYVAVNGSNANPGTIKQPFATVQKAQAAVNPGDTVYIRGGVYHMTEELIAKKEKIFAYVTNLDKSGTPGKYMNYFAYPNETPVFEYSSVKPDDLRVIAFFVSGSWILLFGNRQRW